MSHLVFCESLGLLVAQVVAALKLTPGTTLIDATTGEPESMAAMGAKLAKTGIDYLDATVLGSSRVVRNGTAVVMVCGLSEVWA